MNASTFRSAPRWPVVLLAIAAVSIFRAPLAVGDPALPPAIGSPVVIPPVYDTILAGGKVIDGSGNPWFYGDVGIIGDKVAAVGNLSGAQAKRRIDAHGLVVAPGFIDMLDQSGYSIFRDPRAQSKVFQGITTLITGEGESVAPRHGTESSDTPASETAVPTDWLTFDQYFQRLGQLHPAVNVASFVGAAQIREYVLGNDNRPPKPEELLLMQALVARAMQQGAIGVSTALEYAPGQYAKTDELIALCKAAAPYGGFYGSHVRDESTQMGAAVDEAIEIGKEAGVPVLIFHIKRSGKENWGTMPAFLSKIQAARAAGLDVTASQYPYTAAGTGLAACIPPWYLDGSNSQVMARLKDPATRRKIEHEITSRSAGWEDIYEDAGGAEGIVISGVHNKALAKYEGMTFTQVAKAMHESDLDALLDFCIADSDGTGCIYFLMSEPDVDAALKAGFVSVCTDASIQAVDGPLSGGKDHPRGWGSFPRILGRYVRDEHLLPMELAIRKMTSLAASQAHLTGRGLLKPGFFADVTVFDPSRVIDKATYANPNQLSLGMRYVLVNGELVIDDGKETDARPGRGLRGPGYAGP